MNSKLYLKFIVSLHLVPFTNATTYFGIDREEYSFEETHLQKSYISQILSTEFGTPLEDLPIPDKLKRITFYLEHNKVTPEAMNVLDRFGMAPIHYLAATIVIGSYNEFLQLTKLLIEHGADINLKSKNGITPFVFAVNSGNLMAVRAFAQTGKLVKNIDVLTNMFSEKFDVMEHFNRYQIIYGRGEILKILIRRWAPKLVSSQLSQALQELERVITSPVTSEEELETQVEKLTSDIHGYLVPQKPVETEASRMRIWEDILNSDSSRTDSSYLVKKKEM